MDRVARTPDRVSRINSLLRTVTTRIPLGNVPAIPELPASKLKAVDDAYDEYCGLLEKGEAVDVTAFCERHADYRSELYRRIEVHQFLDDNPDTLDYLEPIPWPQVGDDFGDCQLIEELGRGGVGRVYLAQEKELPRCVVLKLAAVNTGEAERICRLDHDNIVPIYYVRRDEETGLTAICMPFESRYTLVDVLDEAFKTGGPPAQLDDVCRQLFRDEFSDKLDRAGSAGATGYVEDILRLGRHLADALAHSHAKRIYHFDLKPSNVLIKHDGLPWLIDFNMAIDDDHRGEFFGGTKPYMSPEQIHRLLFPLAADAETLDGKSDVYSLGIILCQLLTGQHPFGDAAWNGTEAELLSRQQEWLPAELERCSHVDRKTVALLAECLTFDAQQRPTAAELSVQLNDILRRKKKAPGRRKFLAGLFAAGLGSLAAAVAFGMREPAHVIFYREGLRHFTDGRYDEAIKAYTRSLTSDDRFTAARIGRARTREKRGDRGENDFNLAIDDYKIAYEVTNDPIWKARMGYCAAKRRSYADASAWLNEAIKGGVESAEVFNNLGYCQTKLTYYDAAEENLTRALELDSKLQPPWYNRAVNELYRSERRRVPISETALTDIQTAREAGDDGPELLYFAAAIWDSLSSTTPNREEAIFELLDQALELGLDSSVLTRASPRFTDFRENTKFNAMIRSSRPLRQIARRPHLLQVNSRNLPFGETN